MTVNNLFSNPDIDIIVNLTPPSSHFEISCESLKSGKHVFSEKPVALSIEQGKKLYGLIYKHDRYLFSAPDTTLGPAFTKSQDLILSGKIGEIETSHGHLIKNIAIQSMNKKPNDIFLGSVLSSPSFELKKGIINAPIKGSKTIEDSQGKDSKFIYGMNNFFILVEVVLA